MRKLAFTLLFWFCMLPGAAWSSNKGEVAESCYPIETSSQETEVLANQALLKAGHIELRMNAASDAVTDILAALNHGFAVRALLLDQGVDLARIKVATYTGIADPRGKALLCVEE